MAVPLDLDIESILDITASTPSSKDRTATIPYHTANGDLKMATTTLPVNPLDGFSKVRDRVHVYTPPSPPATDSDEPGLIIICSWAFAQPRHISKYLKGYQSIYPHSKILLVQQLINNMLFQPDSWQMAMFDPAARIVKEYVDSIGDATPRILLQTYSNGGSHSAVQLAESYKKQYGRNLPISAFVMDSTPGQPHYWETIAAMKSSLPKSFLSQVIGTVVAHTVISSTIVMDRAGVAELATLKLYRTLNDPEEAFLQAAIPRTYIHSKEDVMILSRDVEAHADTAKTIMGEKGAQGDMIRVEEFIGTPHVQHMSSDPARYWKIVQDTWDKAQR